MYQKKYIFHKLFLSFIILVLGLTGIVNSSLAFSFPEPEKFFDQEKLIRKDSASGNQEETDKNRKELESQGDEFVEESSRRASNIPTGDLLTDIFPKAIKLIFYGMGVTIFIAFLYIGINLIISRGDEEAMTALKTQIIDVILGAAVVGAALAMVSGIIRVLGNL